MRGDRGRGSEKRDGEEYLDSIKREQLSNHGRQEYISLWAEVPSDRRNVLVD